MYHTPIRPPYVLPFLRRVPRRPFSHHSIGSMQLAPIAVRNRTTYVFPNQNPTRRFKWTRRVLWGLLFSTFGYHYAQAQSDDFFHPPEPGSKQDAIRLDMLSKKVERLSIVQDLRREINYDEWDAYEDITDANKERRLTSGPLKGSRALAVQRIFWDEANNVCFNIVRFGESTDGWPTIVHGGAIATVLDETLGRVAIRSVPAHTGVTAHLQITYLRPLKSNEFYTVKAILDKTRSTDRKSYVNAIVIDQEGKPHCTATALFVVPKSIPLQPLVEHF